MNKLNLGAEHRANLKKLADYLITGETAKIFDMTEYCSAPPKSERHLEDLYNINEYACGTAACALGHGPAAGIEPGSIVSWVRYGETKFGLQPRGSAWEWLFASDWVDIDNTPQGAAKRIYWLLDHNDVPEDWYRQIIGEAPLCYAMQEAA